MFVRDEVRHRILMLNRLLHAASCRSGTTLNSASMCASTCCITQHVCRRQRWKFTHVRDDNRHRTSGMSSSRQALYTKSMTPSIWVSFTHIMALLQSHWKNRARRPVFLGDHVIYLRVARACPGSFAPRPSKVTISSQCTWRHPPCRLL